ncbi:MAG: hypothetical protein A2017_06675 [Lentisphaerae bacterium GWF2_44_16]|nr:MAG: hypothetical protein A2017_06675 [Lentisphaerae bacterium GWF2_44_16]
MAKLKILYCIPLICLCVLTCTRIHAALWEKQGDLDKIVMIEDGSLRGTGFFTVFREKLIVIAGQEVLNSSSEIKLKDVNGKEIKYTKIFIPEDRRDLVIFELDEEESRRPFLTMVENAAQACDIDSSVTVYAFRAGTKTLARAKGKIIGIGPELFELNVKMPDIIGGGPVILKDSGKVIASCSSNPKDGKARMFAARMDTIGKLLELDIAVIREEMTDIKSLSDAVREYDSKSGEFRDSYSRLKTKSDKQAVNYDEVSALLNSINEQISSLSVSIDKWKNIKDWRLPLFGKKYETELKNAIQLLDSLKELNQEAEALIKKE